MADDDRDQEPPASLEPPSLFRRRRRPSPAPVDEQPTEPLQPVDPVTPPQPVPSPAPVPAPRPVPDPEPVPAPEPVTPLFADEVEAEPVAKPAKAPKAPKAPKQPKAPRPPRTPRQPLTAREPVLTGLAAALATGLVVGLLAVGLTSGSLQACEAARGTESCGDAGFFLLLAILIVCVVAGSALLRWSRVPDPGSTSFLAVGLLAVVSLLFLVEHLLDWWMVVVIPVVAVAAYAASWWVTTSVIEPARE